MAKKKSSKKNAFAIANALQGGAKRRHFGPQPKAFKDKNLPKGGNKASSNLHFDFFRAGTPGHNNPRLAKRYYGPGSQVSQGSAISYLASKSDAMQKANRPIYKVSSKQKAGAAAAIGIAAIGTGVAIKRHRMKKEMRRDSANPRKRKR